ncbi:Lrp/AsnC family transcriptional regulator [Allosphingosinicella vermicomposti]|uniref:Lrp/AsnC family transcriptional regulator n=1 Tax=Allosphingosinicella vermicomposti TaxID=614671 RepID=UPI000D0FBEBE|nr:Lrp/AsnC family transcriptional regulator [Allosphingosinicella vermicomposti]
MTAEYRLDRIDRRILKALQTDGRVTNQALADRVALSPSACLARVRHLEQIGVIQGYHARLDPYRLDIGLILLVEVTLAGHQRDEKAGFEAALDGLPQVVEASHVSGDIDYLLKIVVKDMPEWTELRDRLVGDLGVDRVTTHILMDKPKIFIGYPVPDDGP